MREHLRCKLFGHDYPPAAWSVGYPARPHHTCNRCGFFNERLVPPPAPSPPKHNRHTQSFLNNVDNRIVLRLGEGKMRRLTYGPDFDWSACTMVGVIDHVRDWIEAAAVCYDDPSVDDLEDAAIEIAALCSLIAKKTQSSQ